MPCILSSNFSPSAAHAKDYDYCRKAADLVAALPRDVDNAEIGLFLLPYMLFSFLTPLIHFLR